MGRGNKHLWIKRMKAGFGRTMGVQQRKNRDSTVVRMQKPKNSRKTVDELDNFRGGIQQRLYDQLGILLISRGLCHDATRGCVLSWLSRTLSRTWSVQLEKIHNWYTQASVPSVATADPICDHWQLAHHLVLPLGLTLIKTHQDLENGCNPKSYKWVRIGAVDDLDCVGLDAPIVIGPFQYVSRESNEDGSVVFEPTSLIFPDRAQRLSYYR